MYILKLADAENPDNCGYKAFYLSKIVKNSIAVPPGIVLTSAAFEKFLQHNKIDQKVKEIFNLTDGYDEESVRQGSNDIKQLILGGSFPDETLRQLRNAYEEMDVSKEIKNLTGPALDFIKAGRSQIGVAVRLSPTIKSLSSEKFIKDMHVSLNVFGVTEIMDAAKRVWASEFSANILSFLKKEGAGQFPTPAVIIQKMIEPEKSGIIFTNGYLNSDNGNIVIEGTLGYSTILLTGLINPDEYKMDSSSGTIISKRIGKKLWIERSHPFSSKIVREPLERDKVDKQVFEEHELSKIYSLCKNIEAVRDIPQLIEFCISKSKIWLLQARPFSINDKSELVSENIRKGNEIANGDGVSPGILTGKIHLVNTPADLENMEEGNILVFKSINQVDMKYISKVNAVVLESGSKICPVSIACKEIGIPCINGVSEATNIFKEGQEVVLDAFTGRIYEAPVVESSIYPQHPGFQQIVPEGPDHEYYSNMLQPQEMNEKLTGTGIFADISFPESVNGISGKADGVGIFRSEHTLTKTGSHPLFYLRSDPEGFMQSFIDEVSRVAKAFYPKPVWYRIFSASTDDLAGLEGGEIEIRESNPLMGWKGSRRAIDDPEIFNTEIRAIQSLHRSGINNVNILLSLINSAEEVRKIRSLINFTVKLGVIVETPAAAMEIENICNEGIDFVAIDYSLLVQRVLAMDRSNERLMKSYSEQHPSLKQLVRHIIKTAKANNIETSAIGESMINPRILELFVGLGIDSICAEPDALDYVRSSVARIERRLILERARNREITY